MNIIEIQIEIIIDSRSIKLLTSCISINSEYRYRGGYYLCQCYSPICIIIALLVAILLATGIAALVLALMIHSKISKHFSFVC